jgi:hypothetical protein
MQELSARLALRAPSMQELSTRSTQGRRRRLRYPLSPTRRRLQIQARGVHCCRNLEVRGIREARPLEVATAAI